MAEKKTDNTQKNDNSKKELNNNKEGIKKPSAAASSKTVAKKKSSTKTGAKSSSKATSKVAPKKTTTKKSSPSSSSNDKKLSVKSNKPVDKNSKTTDKKNSKKSDENKSLSANKLLGIKKAKNESAKDKKEKVSKKNAEKSALSNKSNKNKKKKVKNIFSKFFAFIKKKNQQRKINKQAKAEAKRNAGPKRVPREVKIMRKRTAGVVFMCLAVSLIVLGGFKLAGALELNAGFAAKTGDKYFTEAEVTKYICDQTLYKTYSKSSSQWQQYLNQYGMNPGDFRKQVIESKFKHEELVKRCAEQEEVTVDPAEVDKHVQSFKNKYNNDANYKKALENAGYTEDTYWDHVYMTLLEKALIERDVHIDQPSDDDVKTYLSSYSSVYKDARKSSHILFNEKDTQQAQEVLDKLKSGALSWDNAVVTYSIDEATKNQGGNRGWDKIESFSMAYNDGLSGLKAGEICLQLVTDKEGIHIIKCSEKWDTPEKIESLDGIPADIIADARQKKYESNQATELNKYLDTFAEENGLETEIYPMPKNVPYYFESKNQGNSINSNAVSSNGTTSVPVQ